MGGASCGIVAPPDVAAVTLSGYGWQCLWLVTQEGILHLLTLLSGRLYGRQVRPLLAWQCGGVWDACKRGMWWGPGVDGLLDATPHEYARRPRPACQRAGQLLWVILNLWPARDTTVFSISLSQESVLDQKKRWFENIFYNFWHENVMIPGAISELQTFIIFLPQIEKTW